MFERINKEMINEAIDNNVKLEEETDKYIRTGYIDLDYRMGGLWRGETYLLAGELNMGHIAFAMNLAKYVATVDKKCVAYLSLRDSKESVVKTFAQIVGETDQVAFHNMDKTEIKNALSSAVNQIDAAKMYISDVSGLDIHEIDDEIFTVGEGVDLLIVDCLSEISHAIAPYKNKDIACRNLEGLKNLAKMHKCAILVLEDLEEFSDDRLDKTPIIADLHNRKLARNVDNILFVYRPDYYDRDSEDKGIAEIVIAQHKHGGTGGVRLAYDSVTQKFSSLC